MPYCNLHRVVPILVTTLPAPLKTDLTFYRSRTDPDKGWTLDSYPGDSQCVLVALLLIGNVDYYQMRGLLTTNNANESGLSVKTQIHW